MPDAILIVEQSAGQDLYSLEAALKEKFAFDASGAEETITYEDEQGRFIALSKDEITPAFYEKEEMDFVKSQLKAPGFYFVEFSDLDLFKQVVALLGEQYSLLVDDDVENIYDKDTFLSLESW